MGIDRRFCTFSRSTSFWWIFTRICIRYAWRSGVTLGCGALGIAGGVATATPAGPASAPLPLPFAVSLLNEKAFLFLHLEISR